MDESTALHLCLAEKDPRGFEFLVEKYGREAHYHAQGFLRNTADAADACQEAFAKAYAALPRMKRLDRFYPWFYTILKNTCFNMLKRQKRTLQYAEDTAALHRAVSKPDQIAQQNEEKMVVKETLSLLKADHREILVLRHFNGFSYDEMAEFLAIPKGTVMSRLHAARKAFRAEYERSGRG